MTLKLSNTAVIFESAGDTVLVCDSFDYNELISLGDSATTLPAGYVNDYFGYTVGTQAGFVAGGYAGTNKNEIDRFSFASEDDTIDIADLTTTRYGAAGTFSNTHGYASGGSSVNPGTPGFVDIIDKFTFVGENNATDVGNLSQNRIYLSGSSSTTHGYSSGGKIGPAFSYANRSDVIDRFPFATDTNASDVGNLTVARYTSGGQQSSTHGYTSGGGQGPGYSHTDVIDKFPFAVSTANATDVGNLNNIVFGSAGQSSFTHGHRSGDQNSHPSVSPPFPTIIFINDIDRFPFATDTNATDLGDMLASNKTVAGFSSNAFGYIAGGNTSPNSGVYSNVIQKFPFSSTFTTTTDVADLTLARSNHTGVQA